MYKGEAGKTKISSQETHLAVVDSAMRNSLVKSISLSPPSPHHLFLILLFNLRPLKVDKSAPSRISRQS